MLCWLKLQSCFGLAVLIKRRGCGRGSDSAREGASEHMCYCDHSARVFVRLRDGESQSVGVEARESPGWRGVCLPLINSGSSVPADWRPDRVSITAPCW